MKNQVAIITGGAQGIGKAITRQLLSRGMAIVIADNDKEAGRETLAEFQALGAVRFIATDVAQEPQNPQKRPVCGGYPSCRRPITDSIQPAGSALQRTSRYWSITWWPTPPALSLPPISSWMEE